MANRFCKAEGERLPTGTTRGCEAAGWNGAYADWVRPSVRFQAPRTHEATAEAFAAR
jgi:hypothetical protein